jgi:signal transduction histidine kinase
MSNLPQPGEAPVGLGDLFQQATQALGRWFAERVEAPEAGSITIAGERYVLVRAQSLSTRFVELVCQLYADRGADEGERVARTLLFDVAHAIGRADAEALHRRLGLVEPRAKLAAGPVHFAFSGWAAVELLDDSVLEPDERFVLRYRHPNSFEAAAWLSEGRRASAPVCTMSAGYSSGWVQESFGLPLVAIETSCRAMGHDHCEFVMAPPDQAARLARAAGAVGVATSPGHGAGERAPLADVPEFFGRKRLEDELRRHRDRLEELVDERTRELQRAHASLIREAEERRRAEAQLQRAQRLEAVGTLAGGIAHDFNNALTSIRLSLDLIRGELQPASEAHADLEAALDATRGAAELVRRLLAFSRPQPPEASAVDLAELLTRSAALLSRSQRKELVVEVAPIDPPLPLLMLDGNQIEQCVINLGLNACEAIHGAGRVVFSAEVFDLAPAPGRPRDRQGQFVRLRAADTGQGMDPVALERAFEPFFTTKPGGKGTGLGLTMVHAAVSAHGGWVELESRPGRGTTVDLYLPLLEASDAPRAVGSVPPRGRGEPILVVDDEPAVRRALTRTLDRQGYVVFEAADGLAALAVLERATPAIAAVVTDLSMPRLDGRGLLRAMRARGEQIPVLLASAYVDDTGAEELLAEGFADLLRKPYEPADVQRALQRVLPPRG